MTNDYTEQGMTEHKKPPPTIAALKQRIEKHWGMVEKSASEIIDRVLDLGDDLIQLKQQIEHGDWERFARENLPFTSRHASNFMRIAKHRQVLESNRKWISDLSGDVGLSSIEAVLNVVRDAERYDTPEQFETLLRYRAWKPQVEGMSSAEYKRSRLAAAFSGEIPKDWTPVEDEFFEQHVKAPKSGKRQERAEQQREEMDEYERKWQESKKGWDKFTRMFGGEEVHLDDPDHDADQRSLFRALDKYFEKFTDDNRKLEALTNVIKHLRGIGAGLHREISSAEGVTHAKPGANNPSR